VYTSFTVTGLFNEKFVYSSVQMFRVTLGNSHDVKEKGPKCDVNVYVLVFTALARRKSYYNQEANLKSKIIICL